MSTILDNKKHATAQTLQFLSMIERHLPTEDQIMAHLYLTYIVV